MSELHKFFSEQQMWVTPALLAKPPLLYSTCCILLHIHIIHTVQEFPLFLPMNHLITAQSNARTIQYLT